MNSLLLPPPLYIWMQKPKGTREGRRHKRCKREIREISTQEREKKGEKEKEKKKKELKKREREEKNEGRKLECRNEKGLSSKGAEETVYCICPYQATEVGFW